jgi:hypothetical protein
MSAWKKLSRNTWVKKISTPRSPEHLEVDVRARAASRSVTGMPRMRSMTMTLRRV